MSVEYPIFTDDVLEDETLNGVTEELVSKINIDSLVNWNDIL